MRSGRGQVHARLLYAESRKHEASLQQVQQVALVHSEISHLPARWGRRCRLQRRRLWHFHIIHGRPLEAVNACSIKAAQHTNQAAASAHRRLGQHIIT